LTNRLLPKLLQPLPLHTVPRSAAINTKCLRVAFGFDRRIVARAIKTGFRIIVWRRSSWKRRFRLTGLDSFPSSGCRGWAAGAAVGAARYQEFPNQGRPIFQSSMLAWMHAAAAVRLRTSGLTRWKQFVMGSPKGGVGGGQKFGQKQAVSRSHKKSR
jgi:hypothetical protein